MTSTARTGAVSFATQHLVVEVNGTALSNELSRRLLAVSVEDSVTLPGGFTLVFRDPFHDVLENGALAFGAAVSIALPDGRSLLTRAEITARECEVDSAGTVTIVRGFDLAHRLHRGRRTEVYRNVRYSDVARQVAQRAGLQCGRIDTPRMSVRPQVMQWNASDWEFLNDLAEEIAYEVTVVDGKLSFAERTQATSARGPQISLERVMRLRCVVSGAEQVSQVEVRGWSPQQKAEVVGTARVAARGSSLTDAPGSAAGRLDGKTLTSVGKLYDQQRDAAAAAAALAQQIGESFGTFEGMAAGDPSLRAGVAVTLGLAGRAFDGKYTLTSTRHTFDDDGYTTWFASGGAGDESLLGMASRPARDSVGGVAPAVVTDVKDPEKLGRVRVSFPWLSSSNESYWARVAQPWAGRGYGAVFVPEVNDEVLVAFEQGDFARPYVVGGLYNGQDKPTTGGIPLVDDASGTVNVRRMETRKHHAVEIVDKFGSEGVFVRTGDGKHAFELDVANTRISVGSQGKVTISGAGGVEITSATGNVEIKGTQVSIQGNGIALDARGPLNMKAGASAVLQGSIVKIN